VACPGCHLLLSAPRYSDQPTRGRSVLALSNFRINTSVGLVREGSERIVTLMRDSRHFNFVMSSSRRVLSLAAITIAAAQPVPGDARRIQLPTAFYRSESGHGRHAVQVPLRPIHCHLSRGSEAPSSPAGGSSAAPGPLLPTQPPRICQLRPSHRLYRQRTAQRRERSATPNRWVSVASPARHYRGKRAGRSRERCIALHGSNHGQIVCRQRGTAL
jgi:hypothetical protein